MKRMLGLAAVLLCCTVLGAQPLKDPPKTLRTYGASGIFLYEWSTMEFFYSDMESEMSVFASVYTGSYSWRKNLFTLNDHRSIGLRIAPSFGILIGEGMDVATNVPITLNFNTGTAATYHSLSTRGFGWSLGVNLRNAPIVNRIMYHEDGVSGALMPDVMLCTSLHFRRWSNELNGDGDGREIELFFARSLSPVSAEKALPVEDFFDLRTPMQFSIFFRRFLNY